MIHLELQSDGSGRAIVLLHGWDPQTCSRLVESFLGLAATEESVVIQAIPGVVASDNCELVAIRRSEHRGVKLQGKRYLWSQDSEGWKQVAGLLAPFREGQERDGFQFLEDQGDATVIFSASGQW